MQNASSRMGRGLGQRSCSSNDDGWPAFVMVMNGSTFNPCHFGLETMQRGDQVGQKHDHCDKRQPTTPGDAINVRSVLTPPGLMREKLETALFAAIIIFIPEARPVPSVGLPGYSNPRAVLISHETPVSETVVAAR